MGFRLNNIKRKVIEYGSQEAFNYMQEEINNLLCEVCGKIYFDDDEVSFSNSFEILKENIKTGIKKLLETPDKLVKENNSYYTYKDVADFLQISLNESKNKHVVSFEWF